MDLAKLFGLAVLSVGGLALVLWLAVTNPALAGPALVVVGVLIVIGIVLFARDASSPSRPPE